MNASVHTGTRGRYVDGCRCTPCTHANAKYQKSRRKKHINLPAKPLLDMFQGLSDDEIAFRLGMNRHTIRRWRQKGISLTVGDRVAISLGVHPLLIWKSDYWKASL